MNELEPTVDVPREITVLKSRGLVVLRIDGKDVPLRKNEALKLGALLNKAGLA